MIRLVSLTVDFNVSMKLLKKQKAEFRKHFNVICLNNRNKTLIIKSKSRNYIFINIAKETLMYKQKMKAQTRLNSYKVKLRKFIIEKN